VLGYKTEIPLSLKPKKNWASHFMNEMAVNKKHQVHLQFYAPRASHTLSNNVELICTVFNIS
jgi:hypothetical protein